jgi:hypothetical protein
VATGIRSRAVELPSCGEAESEGGTAGLTADAAFVTRPDLVVEQIQSMLGTATMRAR